MNKKYLLLASVAGCLMTANAWAEYEPSPATMTVSAKIATADEMEIVDMSFGGLLLTGAAAGDQIASFTNGTLSVVEGKAVQVAAYPEQGGSVEVSGPTPVTGVSFNADTIDLCRGVGSDCHLQAFDFVAPGFDGTLPTSGANHAYSEVNAKLRIKAGTDLSNVSGDYSGTVTISLNY